MSERLGPSAPNLSTENFIGSSAFVHDESAKQSEFILKKRIALPGVIIMYAGLYGVVYPIGCIISAKELLVRKFSKIPHELKR